MDCQKQSNGNASWGVLYTAIIGFGRLCRSLSLRVNYILTLTWGFRRCSFRQSGQCEGLNKWNEWQDWLHVFLFLYINYRTTFHILQRGRGRYFWSMKCKSCLKEIPDDSTFCPNCGNPINSIERCKKKFELKSLSLKSILIIIAFGIWMLVLQNLGIIPVTQDVRVKNTIDADVSGSVYVDGGTISVEWYGKTIQVHNRHTYSFYTHRHLYRLK